MRVPFTGVVSTATLVLATTTAYSTPVSYGDLFTEKSATALTLNDSIILHDLDEKTLFSDGIFNQNTTRTQIAFWDTFSKNPTLTPDILVQIREKRELKTSIAERHIMSAPNSDGRVFVEIRPQGLSVNTQPLTFDHVSGPVGIVREKAAGNSTNDYVFAAVGINTNDIIMTQVKEDPRGIYPIGAKVPMRNNDILKSENSRAAVAFTPEMGAIQELQFILPHYADPDENITISLKDTNGEVTQVIDANHYQIIPANQSRFANVAEIGSVPDFLVLVIKNDAANLSAIYDTMLHNGSFEVQAMSIGEKNGVSMGRLVPSPVAFGPNMAAHLKAAYAQLPAPQFYFATPTADVQRLYSFDPNSTPVDHVAQQCVFLGLQDMSKAERAHIRIFNALVEGGTGVRPRDFEKGYVAVDKFNNLVAAGSAAWLGSNVETQTARVSGSAPTGFLTEGGELLSGCTDHNVVTWSTPVISNPYESITDSPYFPITDLSYVSITDFFTRTSTTTSATPITTVPAVPIEGAERIPVMIAEKIDKVTSFTKIAPPVRNFFEKNWTPLESGALFLEGAIAIMAIFGSGAGRRRLSSAFTSADSDIVDTTRIVAANLQSVPPP